ncbi:hypothetical protein OpiT1DRAFT_04767 [Opitutaceae bacterium TAV1]|nr:hypothetical protein OpiT1DRAFT_04767 [Opitutaceae bacterium TAV1]
MNKCKMIVAGLVSIASAAVVSAAEDYGQVLNDNLSIIDTIWTTVATIVIGVALVAVGTRFFKKAK